MPQPPSARSSATAYADFRFASSDVLLLGRESAGVPDEVHARGGKIFVQLWHVGRVSHVDLQPGGAAHRATMADAHPDVVAVARHRAPSNADDGVVTVIEQLVA